MAARIEMAVERSLEHDADRSRRDEGERQRGEERPAHPVDQDHADIAAGHGEGAVGEVDEVHQAERDREPASEHEQQHAVGNAIEQVGEDRGHRKRVNPGNHSSFRGSAQR